MGRLTKLEREALVYVANDVLAGDAAEFLNGGFAIDEENPTKADRRALKLADALQSAVLKLS